VREWSVNIAVDWPAGHSLYHATVFAETKSKARQDVSSLVGEIRNAGSLRVTAITVSPALGRPGERVD